jgi:hypothetical protein
VSFRPSGPQEPPRPQPRSRGRRFLRLAVLDVSPLQAHPRYRWLFSGQVLFFVARQFGVVAIPYQVFVLTGSSWLVGAVGLVQVLPVLVGSLLGGTLADAGDRRALLVAVQFVMALATAGLVLNAVRDTPAVWPLFVLAGMSAGVSAVDPPARNAVLAALVARERLPAAYALQQTLVRAGHVVGPALAGLAIARTDFATAYAVQSACFLVSGGFLLPVGRLCPDGGGQKPCLASLLEGLRYLRGHPVIQSLLIIDLTAMVLCMPRALFPAIGTLQLGGDAALVGLLYAAPGAGAFAAALTSGWIRHVRYQGRAVVVAVAVWGAAIIGFGISRWLGLSLALLALAGAADVVSAVFRNTILQMSVPDGLRGRMSSLQTAVVASGPRLGDGTAGGMAALTSPVTAVVLGGAACVAGTVLIARAFPGLWTYRDTAAGP